MTLSNAKKVGEYVKDQIEKNLKGVTVNIKTSTVQAKTEIRNRARL